MFPSLRINNLYRDMNDPQGMPDFNDGMPDINSLLSTIMELRKQQHYQDYNESQMQQFQQEQKQNRLQAMAHAAALEQASKPKNVVFGGVIPSAFPIDDQSHDVLGYSDPKLAAIAQRMAAANQNADLKRQTLESTSDYRDRALEQKGRLGEESNAIKADRAEVYRYKSMHPDHKLMQGKDGHLRAVNPQTDEVTDLGPTGMSDQEVMDLNQSNALERIGAQGENQQVLQGMRGNQALDQIAARVAGQKEVNAAKPERGELPTQTRVRQNLTAHEFVNKHPDLAKYITFNGDGTFSVSKNAPSEVASQINTVLYGRQKSSAPTATSPKQSTGRVTVEKDGQRFTVPADQVEEAKKQGYKVSGGK